MDITEPRPKNDDEKVLPLINVVFLLLIFFMIAGHLEATDPFLIDPPSSSSEGAAEMRELVVLVGPDGQLALDGVVMDAAALEAAVAERFTGGATPMVWLKGDAGADAVQAIEVMEILRAAGVERLKLLTVPVRADGAR